MLQDVISVISPFSATQLEDIRYKILVDMRRKEFSHYIVKMNEIQESVRSVLRGNKDRDFMNDDLWVTSQNKRSSIFSKDKAWWAQESPWLEKKRRRTIRKTGTGYFTNRILSPTAVDSLIGAAPWFTPQQLLFSKTLLSGYFQQDVRLWPVTLNIEMSYLLYSRKDTSFGANKQLLNFKKKALLILKYALAGSGPFMLKILQQISNKTTEENPDHPYDSDVVELTSTIFDAVPPLTTREFDLVLESVDLPRYYVKNINRKPLGSASLAQTHQTTDAWGDAVILKLLRPVYAYYYICECDYLLSVLWKKIATEARSGQYETTNTDMLIRQTRQLLLFLVKEYIAEFDYRQEAIYNVIGYQHYNKPEKWVRSAQLLQWTENRFPAMIQTMAGDITIKSLLNVWSSPVFLEEYPDGKELIRMVSALLYASMTKLMGLWFRTAFWAKDSFFHGDLHMGNIMTLDFHKLVALAKRGATKAPIYVIDYGSSGILSDDVKCKLLTAMLQSGKMHSLHTLIPDKDKDILIDDFESSGDIDIHENKWTREILPFFHAFEGLTASQQIGLREAVDTNKVRKKHRHNVEQVQKFIKDIWALCSVKDRSGEHMIELYPKILNYSEEFTFGNMFLRLVRHGRGIGMCTSNPVILFGRGVAYISDNVLQLEALCGNCKKYTIDKVVRKRLMRHPLQFARMVNGQPVC